jgi:hypothetical protein
MNEDNFVTYTAHRHAIGDGAASVTCGSFTMGQTGRIRGIHLRGIICRAVIFQGLALGT